MAYDLPVGSGVATARATFGSDPDSTSGGGADGGQTVADILPSASDLNQHR
jgi:hypothetical protein